MEMHNEDSLPLMESEKDRPLPFLHRIQAACLSFLSRTRSRNDARQLRKTAYLDGLRGFSALLVYLHHHLIWAHAGLRGQFVLENAYGWRDKHYFALLPIVRVFFSGGNSAVAIFYVISGYVLSASPVKAVHSADSTRLSDCLSSAFFRRWIRLFVPVLATTFVWMTCWHIFGIKSHNPIAKKPEETYGQELWMFYKNFKGFSFIFHENFWNDYNDHVWSIPLEFRGSVIVWIVLLAFARCSSGMRLLLETGMMIYFTCIVDGWYCACFIIGLLLCELDTLAEMNQLPSVVSHFRPQRSWIYYILMLLAMYLLGVPPIQHSIDPAADLEELRTEQPGWYLLSFLVPEPFRDYRWFFRIVASTLIMISIPRIHWLNRFFESRFCQFLGRISFSFYLIHGPILWSIGDRVYAAVGLTDDRHRTQIPGWMDALPLPNWGPLGLEINYLAAQVVLLPFTLWVASVVTKLVDEPSVKLARRMFEYVT